jgi:predicted nuclease of predicted toxin-antitoxin system
MIIWVDAQMSPRIARWLRDQYSIEVHAIRELGLCRAEDEEIFQAARTQAVVVMTKDEDFVQLVERFGPPPQILWITCGNTSDESLREILSIHFSTARALLESGEPVVEIS